VNSRLPAIAPILAAFAWTIALMVDPGPYNAAAVLLIGVGMIMMAAVSVVGIIANGARWAYRLGLAVIAGTAVVATIRPIDAAWIVGLIVTSASAVLMFFPGVTGSVRKLPAAAGPPEKAVILSLVLLSAPFLIGVAATGGAGWAHLVAGLSGMGLAFIYSRVIPGGLVAVRFLWPLIAVALAVPMGLPSGALSVGLALVGGWLAWTEEARVAFHPPRETGSTYPIPPELAPQDILDAAQLDEKGRRL